MDGVHASPAVPGHHPIDTMLPLRGLNTDRLLSFGNAVQTSNGLNSVAGTLPTYEPPKNTVQASLLVGRNYVSAGTAAGSLNAISVSSGFTPDSAVPSRDSVSRSTS